MGKSQVPILLLKFQIFNCQISVLKSKSQFQKSNSQSNPNHQNDKYI